MNYIFNVGQRVAIVDDILTDGCLNGCQGVIIDVAVNQEGDTVYDVEFGSNRGVRAWFLALELKGVE